VIKAAKSPKSGGVSHDCRMMERVVPMGSSFFECGTMAMRPPSKTDMNREE
jgi:hypothetical protein